MRRHFHKMHGLGNDFVILDARPESGNAPLEVTAALARAIADRRTGVGCDQLILLEPADDADLKMRIFNADGGEVESCGNATRCVVALTGARIISTAGGKLEGAMLGDSVEVAVPEPRFDWSYIPLAYPMDTARLPLAWGPLAHPAAVNVGNPHLVFFVEDVDAIALEELGPTIENDDVFPDMINVNVASVEDGGLRLRTWERGTGLTRACGTGACASAVAAIAAGLLSNPVQVTMTGGTLEIDWDGDGPIRMRGAATHVFEGELDLETLS
jgi:diaminopimelate epimerase